MWENEFFFTEKLIAIIIKDIHQLITPHLGDLRWIQSKPGFSNMFRSVDYNKGAPKRGKLNIHPILNLYKPINVSDYRISFCSMWKMQLGWDKMID